MWMLAHVKKNGRQDPIIHGEVARFRDRSTGRSRLRLRDSRASRLPTGVGRIGPARMQSPDPADRVEPAA